MKYDEGLLCGLDIKPEINHDFCSQYDPDESLIERTEYNYRITHKKEKREMTITKIGLVIGLVVGLVASIIQLVDWATLNSNHRYTIAKMHITHQSGIDKFLGSGGYRCEFEYQFYIGNSRYYNYKTIGTGKWGKLAEPLWNKQILVKYNPDNPYQNEVIHKADVENIDLNSVPKNGIHSDSLNIFLSTN
ncbi:MAG: hypothetical protein AB8B73_00465 [Ekhidna sp.]